MYSSPAMMAYVEVRGQLEGVVLFFFHMGPGMVSEAWRPDLCWASPSPCLNSCYLTHHFYLASFTFIQSFLTLLPMQTLCSASVEWHPGFAHQHLITAHTPHTYTLTPPTHALLHPLHTHLHLIHTHSYTSPTHTLIAPHTHTGFPVLLFPWIFSFLFILSLLAYWHGLAMRLKGWQQTWLRSLSTAPDLLATHGGKQWLCRSVFNVDVYWPWKSVIFLVFLLLLLLFNRIVNKRQIKEQTFMPFNRVILVY